MSNIPRNCRICGCPFDVPSAKVSVEHCIIKELNTTAFLCVKCASKLIKDLQTNSIDHNSSSEVNSILEKTEQTGSEKPYQTVNVGGRIWMAENLNLTDDKLSEDHWINPSNNEVYYTWEAAMRLAKKVPDFHIPTAEEWNQLAEACGGVCRNPIKNNPGFRVYDNIQELKNKLSIKLAGYYRGSFYNVGSYAYFWTSTEGSSSNAYLRSFDTGSSMDSYASNKSRGFSVRLVKD